MTTIKTIKCRAYIIKLTSVFNLDSDFDKALKHYQECFVPPDKKSYFKGNYIEEFREFMFPLKEEADQPNRCRFFQRTFEGEQSPWMVPPGCEPETTGVSQLRISSIELMLSPKNSNESRQSDQIGLLSISLNFKSDDLSEISNALYYIRSFSISQSTEQCFAEIVENDYLGFSFITDTLSQRYSGAKFKLFIVADTDDIELEDFPTTLYDLGSSSSFGSARGEGPSAVHPRYLKEIDQHYLGVFKNHESLVLTDSFTTIGHHLLCQGGEIASYKEFNWGYVIFRIYLYTLYLRFNIYRYQTMWRDDEHASRVYERLARFYDHDYLQSISYNFLAEFYYDKLTNLLEIDDDLFTIKERMYRISERAQTKLAKRQASYEGRLAFLGFVFAPFSVLSGLYGMNIFKGIEQDLPEALKFTFSEVLGISILFTIFLWGIFKLYDVCSDRKNG